MKLIKWLFLSIFVFAGVLMLDGGSGVLVRTLFHDGSRYYELTAKLEVYGEPVEVKRVIECKPYFTHRLNDVFQKRWYRDREAMTQRLSDGSGLIVVVPRLCEEYARPQPEDAPSWKAFPELPEDFVPLIFWTPDADNPEMLEGYHSFEAVARPGSRIRFNEIVLRNSPDLEPGDYPEEFGVWVNTVSGGQRGGYRQRRWTLNYRGYYILALERAEWEHVPELKADLDTRTTSGFLETSLKNFTGGLDTDRDALAIKGVMSVRRSNNRKFDGVESNRFHLDVLQQMHGVLREGDGFVFSDNHKGIINYFKQTKRDRFNWVREDFVDIKIDENAISWPNRSIEYYYDIRSGVLYKLGISILTFHVNQPAIQR